MHKPILILFIDALPYDRGNVIAENLQAKTYQKTVPGVGYSINVKAELFAGLNPDEVGFFCEWNYSSDKKLSLIYKMMLPFLEFFTSKSNFINRVVHRIFGYLLKERVYAIPYNVLPLMVNSGPTSYEWAFDKPTLLTDGDFKRVLYSEEGVNDERIFKKTIEIIAQGDCERLFVSTAQLDGVMHHYGMKCDEYENQIKLINTHVTDIVNKFIDVNGEDALYFIISDHGMASVEQAIEFDIEKKFGPPGNHSYVHFIDATFYRVWINKEELRDDMLKELNNLDGGRVLNQKEREHYGIVDNKHGDIIYLLDEGYQFAPSFFGKGICKSMHGYDSELESQLGIFISNADGDHGSKISAKNIYACIKNYI